MQKAIALLSGGMDSTTALWYAARQFDVVSGLFFDYKQQGHEFEKRAVRKLVQAYQKQFNTELPWRVLRVTIPAESALVGSWNDVTPQRRTDGLPTTFVPGRNLIFLANAASLAYELGAKVIVGGWVQQDVDYPDCSIHFLSAAENAVNKALGFKNTGPSAIEIHAPVINFTKRHVVQNGSMLGVPWELTRSCYAMDEKPCLQCDSCLLRVAAFIDSGKRDPLVKNDKTWDALVKLHSKGDF
jgi:7-cyano-7-deazaguanine synthase